MAKYIDHLDFTKEGFIGQEISIAETCCVVTTASTQVLAANPNRLYARFQNISDTVIHLSLGGTATTSLGVYLAASGGAYEINQNNRYTGAVSAISSVTNKNLLVESA